MVIAHIVSTLEEKERTKEAVSFFKNHGIEVPYDWITAELHESKNPKRKIKEEFDSIKNSDLFVLMNPRGGGKGVYIKFGYALALGKPCFVVGNPENVSLLFKADNVFLCNNLNDILLHLKKLKIIG